MCTFTGEGENFIKILKEYNEKQSHPIPISSCCHSYIPNTISMSSHCGTISLISNSTLAFAADSKKKLTQWTLFSSSFLSEFLSYFSFLFTFQCGIIFTHECPTISPFICEYTLITIHENPEPSMDLDRLRGSHRRLGHPRISTVCEGLLVGTLTSVSKSATIC